jgi:DNA-binding response OmpR family regulator
MARALRNGCGMEGAPTGTIVLVAEDDPHALSGYVEFLSTAGFVAYGRGNGREALATALEIIPDIVVTDIAMPGLDGFGLAAALRAHSLTRDVPIVGMTAHWTADTQSDGQRAGFSAMLLKPCTPTHLLAEIERVLKQKQAELAAGVIAHESSLPPAPPGFGEARVEPAVPVGLRNAVLRRRGVDY